MLQSHNGILHNENECSMPQHYAEQKKPDKNEYTLYDPFIAHARRGKTNPQCWKSGLWKGISQKGHVRLLSMKTVEGALEYSVS